MKRGCEILLQTAKLESRKLVSFVAVCSKAAQALNYPTNHLGFKAQCHTPEPGTCNNTNIMNFGFGVGDIMAISGLAIQVCTAYKDAPDDYRNIADEVDSLHIIIEEAAQHFESTTLSNKKQKRGKKVLEGCRNVLKDLDALIEKYKALAPANANANASQVFRRIKLGTEDIVTLRARLTSNTTLLNVFIQRLDIAIITITITIEYIILISRLSCDSHKLDKMQAQLDKLVLRRTSSRDSLISLAGSINTGSVYRDFCKGLFDSGVTAEMIKGKEKEIHDMLKPRNATTSSQIIDVSTSASQSQLPEGSNPSNSGTLAPLPTMSTEPNQNRLRFPQVLPSVDFLVGPLMLDAAKAGNFKRLKSTLRYVRDINFVDNYGYTALHEAASRGYIKIVQLLLSKGALITATNARGTPLHLAASYGYPRTVELLLSKGASIEAVDSGNYTPLHRAAFNGHTSTVELLLIKGASIEAVNKHNDTPLHLAAFSGYPSTVELLLSEGASIEAADEDNTTPLHVAASNGNPKTVQLLLSKGASTEAANKDNSTPLHCAAQNGHTSTVKLLLSKGASIEVTDKDNNTPLHCAVQCYDNTTIVELLLSKGVPIEATNKDSRTPLHLAAQRGITSNVELLLSKGASIEATDKDNDTPLHCAARHGRIYTVELLLSKGASIEAINKNNKTPLYLARRSPYATELVKLFERAKVTNS